jgi:DNA-binding NtrC family response regulator
MKTLRQQQQTLQNMLIGRSPAFHQLLGKIERYRDARAPILIEGETGTGKEMVARALHYSGCRRGGPFVPVNCAALPEALVESELFGHRRGAFTGAQSNREGLVETARGGILFLDEVDSLSLKAQASLLRFLQDGSYRPVGANREQQAQTSIVAACNRDLEQLAASGQFRSDLYYRLNVLRLRVPPLRERREDILLLANHFLEQFRIQYNREPCAFSASVRRWLVCQEWPGNVRELEAFVHRALLNSEGCKIGMVDETPSSSREEAHATWENFASARQRVIENFERHYLLKLMAYCRGNVSRAARLAGKDRRCIGRLLQKYGIDRRNFLATAETGNTCHV